NVLKHNHPGACDPQSADKSTDNCAVIDKLIAPTDKDLLYVFSMPNEDINSLMVALQEKYAFNLSEYIPNNGTGYYIKLSLSADMKPLLAQTIHDGISAPNEYPPIPPAPSTFIDDSRIGYQVVSSKEIPVPDKIK